MMVMMKMRKTKRKRNKMKLKQFLKISKSKKQKNKKRKKFQFGRSAWTVKGVIFQLVLVLDAKKYIIAQLIAKNLTGRITENSACKSKKKSKKIRGLKKREDKKILIGSGKLIMLVKGISASFWRWKRFQLKKYMLSKSLKRRG